MKIPQAIKARLKAAFTLPEVIIAVGISALGLTSLLSLMPASLDTLRRAGEVSSESRIAQQIFASVSMTDWQSASGADQLQASYNGKRYRFDDLAVELDGSRDAFDTAYVAEVSVAQADLALPGEKAASNTPDPNLRRVTVKVATTPLADFNFTTAPAGTYRTYASVISRTGK